MATVEEAFALALRLQHQGELRQADYLCRHILQAHPNHSDSHHLLGVLAYQLGQYEQAINSIRNAIALNPCVAVCYCNLGLAFEASGRIEEAVTNYRQALELDPLSAEAHSNLGNALRGQGELDEAIAQCRRAIELCLDFPEAHNNLGNALLQKGEHEQAIASFRHALRLNPSFADTYDNLGTALLAQEKLEEGINSYQEALRLNPQRAQVHYNLGIALERQDHFDEAIRCYHNALRLQPDFAEAHFRLASALLVQEKADEAIIWFQKALRLKPDWSDAHTNMGNAFARLNILDQAIESHRQALKCNPQFAEAHTNLGNVLALQEKLAEASQCHEKALEIVPSFVPAWTNLGSVRTQQCRFDEALTCYEQALSHDGGHVQTHFNRSLLWLLLGMWDKGWPEYEWRWKTKGHGRYSFQQPRWDGSPLDGRTVLVFAEQGLGDTLQFIRYSSLIQERGGRVVFQCQPQLMRLLSGARGIDSLLTRGDPLPEFDCYAPLLSLPDIFHTFLQDIPAAVPYLQADAKLIEHWREVLKQECTGAAEFLVGIAWQGTSTYRGDRQRSISFRQFEVLSQIPGVKLVSLQKGPGTEQLTREKDQKSEGETSVPIIDFGDRLDEGSGPFMDTAALMMNLDLVISSDTAIPHLAGALGVPVWLALPQVPDWRWLLQREDSPWYPTMHLFRQTRYGQWEDVFDRIAARLKGARDEKRTKTG